jgi:hypothetical protein
MSILFILYQHKKKHSISIEANPVHTSSQPPLNISSRQVVVDDQMMMDLLGTDYTMDEIREETGG